MKLFRTLALFSLLISLPILYWNCKDGNVSDVKPNQLSETDDPPEEAALWVHEYCHITPVVGDPYDAFLQVRLITKYFPPNGYVYDSFTTPDDDRTVGGIRYQTIYFRVTKSAFWKCEPSYCAARYNIAGVLSEDHFFNNSGGCSNCSPYPNNCGSYYDEDIEYLPELTSYNMWVGVDCIVGGGDNWEIGE